MGFIINFSISEEKMANSIKSVLVCKDKSERKPDGVAFSIELDNGMIAFDVCYNGNIKNISESWAV